MGDSVLEPRLATQRVLCAKSEEEELAAVRAKGWDDERMAQIAKAICNHRGKSAALR